MGAVNGKFAVAVGVFLAGLALGGWLIFLAGEGLDRADQWSSVVGAVAAVLLGLGGLVIGALSWREARRANERPAVPPGASPRAPSSTSPGGPTAGPAPVTAPPAGPVQLNLASGDATVYGVQGGNLYLGDSAAPPAPESGR